MLDEFAHQSDAIDFVDIGVAFAFDSFLVEAFTDFKNGGIFLILIIVVAIVVIVVVVVIIANVLVVVIFLIFVIPIILGGLHTQNSFVSNDALAGVRQGLAAVELFVNALRTYTISKSKALSESSMTSIYDL